MGTAFRIEDMQQGDWRRVREIFADGLSTGLAAFMTSPPTWHAWDASHFPFGRLVARRGDDVLGWVALTRAADT